MIRMFFSGFIVIISMLGYLNYLVNVKDVNLFIAPAVLIATITGTMYIAGLLNIMPLTVAIVLVGGAGIGIYYRNEITLNPIKGQKTALFMCFLLYIYLLYFTWGGLYQDGDTMTHWGIIVREMCRNDRLPNFSNTAITYQSYPPAASCWIYFVLKVFGYGEGKALFAQGIWMISCAAACFSFNQKRSKTVDILITICSVFSLRWLGGLWVDVVLSLTAVALAAIIFEYRSKLEEQMILSAPFVLIIPMIKNSGVLFVAYACILSLFISEQAVKKNIIKIIGLYILIAGGAWVLWESHIKMVYSQANTSRHSMSLKYMRSVFLSKSAEDIQKIIKSFISKWFSINGSYEWQWIIILCIVIIMAVIVDRRYVEVMKGPLLITTYYLFYKVCLLGMYLTNMPGDDAMNVGGYERYQYSFTVMMMFIVVWIYCTYVANAARADNTGKMIRIAGAFSIIIGILYTFPIKEYLRPDYQKDGVHRQLMTMLSEGEEGIHIGSKVLAYNSYRWSLFFVQFTFENQECASTYDIEVIKEALLTNEQGFEYLVITTFDDNIFTLLNEYGYAFDQRCIKLNSLK